MNWETILANGEGKLGIRSKRQRNWKSLSKRHRRHGEGRQVIEAKYGKQNRGWRPAHGEIMQQGDVIANGYSTRQSSLVTLLVK